MSRRKQKAAQPLRLSRGEKVVVIVAALVFVAMYLFIASAATRRWTGAAKKTPSPAGASTQAPMTHPTTDSAHKAHMANPPTK